MEQNTVKQTDHFLEVVFSYTRWFFLLAACTVYFLNEWQGQLEGHLPFIYLVGFGLLYMGVTQYCLHKCNRESRFYKWMTKGGVIFDLVAYPWLIAVTGGFESPFVPIGYLIVLHAILYWRYMGGVLGAAAVTAGFTGVLAAQGFTFSGTAMMTFMMNTAILFLFAVLGGVIISRERKHYAERVVYEQMAKRDYLTGLYNHRTFQEHLLSFTSGHEPFYLVMGDIDHFKSINDTYGHLTGDRVLKKIGESLKDTNFDGHAYRYGGEEFALIVRTSSEEAVHKLIMQISRDVERRNRPFLPNFKVTLSYGCAPGLNVEPEVLIKQADDKLYKAKARGKNQVAGLGKEPAAYQLVRGKK
ncbi:GGDEF domain-containing protein [Alteribacter lacisalsi]|uniref:GGDEF domain-containing protein n=1 Tax=Alteribacter lacisalsi TaxID=2045244 RepID=A0A2W0H4T0_9BACI|nr:GGDEF domain-containing protein [Alteribacter lacisalsi]PYZ96167.1 GGDEF domain-containing protein [Alteribacter lacisalsi]